MLDDLDLIAQDLRAEDRVRFAATLLAKGQNRARAQAVFAFGQELSRIPALVSEPGLAMIRYKWWEEELTKAFAGEPGRAPLLKVLGRMGADLGVCSDDLVGLVHSFAGTFADQGLDPKTRALAQDGAVHAALVKALGGGADVQTLARQAGAIYGLWRTSCADFEARTALLSDMVLMANDMSGARVPKDFAPAFAPALVALRHAKAERAALQRGKPYAPRPMGGGDVLRMWWLTKRKRV